MNPIESAFNASGTPAKATIARGDGRIHISIPQTDEIRELLAEIATYNLKAVLFECRYIRNVCDLPWHTSYFIGQSPHRRDSPQNACEQLAECLQQAIRGVMTGKARCDLDLQISLQLTRDPSTGTWAIKGTGTVWQLIEDLDDVSMTFS